MWWSVQLFAVTTARCFTSTYHRQDSPTFNPLMGMQRVLQILLSLSGNVSGQHSSILQIHEKPHPIVWFFHPKNGFKILSMCIEISYRHITMHVVPIKIFLRKLKLQKVTNGVWSKVWLSYIDYYACSTETIFSRNYEASGFRYSRRCCFIGTAYIVMPFACSNIQLHSASESLII